MKIRGPSDPSGKIPEPEGVDNRKAAEFPDVQNEQQTAESDANIKTRRAESEVEILNSLQGITGKEELSRKFVDAAISDFEDSISSEDLERIQKMISEQLEEDPYLEGKLDRISSLLAKEK